MDLIILIIVFIVGLFASFLGGLIGGGGGLISIPAMAFFGLPPNMAVATNRFGTLGWALSAIYKFIKTRKIVFKYVVPLTILSVIGSVIGARLLIEIDEAVLSKVIGILIVAILPFMFLKNYGLKRKIVSKTYRIFGFISYMGLSVYDGFFGAAAGIVATYLLVFFFGLTYIEANATDKIPWSLNTLISTTIFALYGLINYTYGVVLFAGMFVGGYIGAHVAIKKGNEFVRIAFSLLVIVFAAKLLFF